MIAWNGEYAEYFLAQHVCLTLQIHVAFAANPEKAICFVAQKFVVHLHYKADIWGIFRLKDGIRSLCKNYTYQNSIVI